MEDHVEVLNGGAIVFSGFDATRLFAAMSIRAAIKLHKNTRMFATRGLTVKSMFAAASRYTGVVYKRGDHDRAISNLTVWIETMKSALPVVIDHQNVGG